MGVKPSSTNWNQILLTRSTKSVCHGNHLHPLPILTLLMLMTTQNHFKKNFLLFLVTLFKVRVEDDINYLIYYLKHIINQVFSSLNKYFPLLYIRADPKSLVMTGLLFLCSLFYRNPGNFYGFRDVLMDRI